MELLSTSLVDWSRAQFALTAAYHWLFVPLTLGLGLVMCILETIYVKTGNEVWKRATKFWMTVFGINFAIGVATGLILEFEFGTNWSNYSYLVGDIFGAPLAIEGVLAFFMEATFISLMFFGWKKLSKGGHLASTWLTVFGATISAFWILVANAWMQHPAGALLVAETQRMEMTSFWAVLSPVAINKFFHTVVSSWVLGAVFVLGISCWFLLKKRDVEFALKSVKVASIVGVVAMVLTIWTGHGSAQQVAEKQPMKLAAMEGLYDGKTEANLVGFGILNPAKTYDNAEDAFLFKIDVPISGFLSWIATYDSKTFVPGAKDIINGGYTLPDGTTAPSFAEKRERGLEVHAALKEFNTLYKAKDTIGAKAVWNAQAENFKYFGYSYLNEPTDLIPNVTLVFYSFHIMVILGGLFLLLFILALILKGKIAKSRWFNWIAIICIPLAYLCSQMGWVVAEVGRFPWAINEVLPLNAAVSQLTTSSVQVTFFLFLALFTALLIAEVTIMVRQIRKGF
ncbi:MAG: cytochrome ubiquinol oxidase subunit I [Prevotellaceae bacterium]|jgi:cytochrome d ubiquinol oxidase subunit I|nr:cytochrome ubiquinol oxidase subunit I [Prevotellaceae bacterium]